MHKRDIRIFLAIFILSVIMFVAMHYFAEISAPKIFSKKNTLRHKFFGFTMGTRYSIIIDQKLPMKIEKIQKKTNELLEKINEDMSTYRKTSHISRFNQNKNKNWFFVSKELVKVVAYAHKISKKSKGSFDITVGPLVNLWGFGAKNSYKKIPSLQSIETTKSKIGYQKLEFNLKNSSLRKLHKDLYIDLGAIAKGYGVDQVAQLLDSMGIKNYMVEIGGEIKTRGKRFDGQDWKIGIETPISQACQIQNVISLSNKSIATSGDYRNYFEKDGVRFSHTIDPNIGKPITHKLASVSIIHDSCMHADAMATAIMVLGPERGYKLALREKLACYLLIKVKGKKNFREKMTPEFKKFLLP